MLPKEINHWLIDWSTYLWTFCCSWESRKDNAGGCQAAVGVSASWWQSHRHVAHKLGSFQCYSRDACITSAESWTLFCCRKAERTWFVGYTCYSLRFATLLLVKQTCHSGFGEDSLCGFFLWLSQFVFIEHGKLIGYSLTYGCSSDRNIVDAAEQPWGILSEVSQSQHVNETFSLK